MAQAISEALERRQLFAVTPLAPQHDAFIRNGTHADTEFGVTTPDALEVKTDITSYSRTAFMAFDIASLGTTISSAVLKAYGNLSSAGSEPISVHALQDPNAAWGEDTINWNNAPALDSTAVATTNVTTTTDALYTWDLTQLLQDAKNNGRSTLTIALRRNGGNSAAGVYFNSAEYATTSLRPELLVDHTTPPTGGDTVDIRAVDDAYVRDGTYGDTAFGFSAPESIQAKLSAGAGSHREAWLKFPINSFDSVDSATLKLGAGCPTAPPATCRWPGTVPAT